MADWSIGTLPDCTTAEVEAVLRHLGFALDLESSSGPHVSWVDTTVDPPRATVVPRLMAGSEQPMPNPTLMAALVLGKIPLEDFTTALAELRATKADGS